MINIIHSETHYNDKRKITAIEVKLKYFKNGNQDTVTDHSLVTTVSAAFYKTTLLTDSGRSLNTSINPNRSDIVNLVIFLKKDNDLTFVDVGRFLDALQKALDETPLF